jgi:outer membrane protein assembly factor BamB
MKTSFQIDLGRLRDPSLVLALLWILSPLAFAAEWSQFRGPNGDGHSAATDLPLSWTETENVTWKVPVRGRGWSSPVVWKDQIWLTTAPEDGAQMSALCFDAKTGKTLHDLPMFERTIPVAGLPRNTYATPTPVIEDGRVYIHFGTHGTACLDTKTGKKLWERLDLKCQHFRRPASSPILHDDILILIFDGFDVQYVIGLDKNSGKTLWKTDRNITYGTDNGDWKKAFATAAVVELAGKTQIVCPSAAATIAYEPATGKEIWRIRHGGMNAAARPISGHGLVFVSAPYGGANLLAMRPDGTGDITKSHIVWTYKKSVPKHGSQLLVDDLIYMVSDDGVASCLEAKTGKKVWIQRLGGKYSASPIYAGGRIYFFSEKGVCPVITTGRDYKLLATPTLKEGFMASPAVLDNAFIFRTIHHLYRVEK